MSDMVSFVDAAADEFEASAVTMATVRSAGRLGDMPVYVVTAGEQPPDDPAVGQEWSVLQDELAALSTNSAHDTVDGATHISLVTREGNAVKTTAAILAVVEAARSGGRLTSSADERSRRVRLNIEVL